MGIGTSKGAFYEDQFHYSQSQWDPKYDDNEVTPQKRDGNKTGEELTIDPSMGVGIDVSDKYDTPLTPEQQTEYSKRFSPEDSKDYDMQGWFKANPDSKVNDPGVHYPDTYKKPNHPTFSDESVYNGQDGNVGGHWGKEGDRDTFTPGPTNMKNYGRSGMQDYFNRVEPDVKLNLSK